MTVDQLNSLIRAFEESGWDIGNIERICSGDWMRQFKQVVGGVAEIVMKKPNQFPVLTDIGQKIGVPALAAKATSNCFSNKQRYYYRDPDIKNFLPSIQSGGCGGEFNLFKLNRRGTLKDLANFFGFKHEYEVIQMIKDKGATTTLPTIEWLIDKHEKDKYSGLVDNGDANLFPVLDKNGTPLFVDVSKNRNKWSVDLILVDHADTDMDVFFDPGQIFF